MKKWNLIIGCMVVLLVFIAPSAYANLITNGSFEDGYYGWSKSGNVWIHGVVHFSEHNSSPNGSVWQEFDTEPGKVYRLVFDYAAHGATAAGGMKVRVSVGTSPYLVDTIFTASTTTWDWETATIYFIAEHTTTLLKFQDVSTRTYQVDLHIYNVSVIDLIDHIESCEGDRNDCEDDLEAADATITGLEDDLNAANTAKAQLQLDLDAAVTDLALANETIAQQEDTITDLNEESDSLTVSILSGDATEEVANHVEEGAQKAIDKAKDEGGDEKEIEKAEKEMEKADKEIDKEKYDKAIDHYEKAWDRTEKALKKKKEGKK